MLPREVDFQLESLHYQVKCIDFCGTYWLNECPLTNNPWAFTLLLDGAEGNDVCLIAEHFGAFAIRITIVFIFLLAHLRKGGWGRGHEFQCNYQHRHNNYQH